MNKERDYLKVAQIENEETILARHWMKVAEDKIWVSRDGEKTPINKISHGRLINICKMLIRFNSETSKPALDMVLEEILRRLRDKEE